MAYKMAAWCLVLGLTAACEDPKRDLADLRSACEAGSGTACNDVTLRERQIKLSQQRLYTHPSGATPGCQQGFEGELTCVKNF